MTNLSFLPMRTPIFFVVLNILGILLLNAPAAQATTIVVNTTDDATNAAVCSLRAAVRASNGNTQVGACAAGEPGLDTILLSAGLYQLTQAGPGEDQAQSGDLDLREAVLIRGAGRESTIIDGGNQDRLFAITAGITVTLDSLTLQHGHVAPSVAQTQTLLTGGAIVNAGWLTLTQSAVLSNSLPASATLTTLGGAIYNTGHLVIADTLLQGNSAQQGGALYAAAGSVALTTTTLSANTAERGGAIANGKESLLTLADSQLLSNTAQADNAVGGGLLNAGSLTMTSVLIANNQALPNRQTEQAYGQGGGIANLKGASAFLAGVTFEHNAADSHFYPEAQGGGIYNQGSLRIEQSRIIDNGTSSDGGGVYGGGEYRAVLIENNHAGRRGGGLFGLGNLTNVTISHNTVGEFGQGAGGYGCGHLVNVTISHNHADDFGRGGGLSVDFTDTPGLLIGTCLELRHVTVVSNTAMVGSGLALRQVNLAGVIVQSSVIAQNDGDNNCNLSAATIISLGHNYVDDASCQLTQPSDRQGDQPDPLLGPLADNGSANAHSPSTHMPQPGSPLIDSGSCDPSSMTDQNGAARPQGYGCDIGAVEAPGAFLQFLPLVAR